MRIFRDRNVLAQSVYLLFAVCLSVMWPMNTKFCLLNWSHWWCLAVRASLTGCVYVLNMACFILDCNVCCTVEMKMQSIIKPQTSDMMICGPSGGMSMSINVNVNVDQCQCPPVKCSLTDYLHARNHMLLLVLGKDNGKQGGGGYMCVCVCVCECVWGRMMIWGGRRWARDDGRGIGGGHRVEN